ncbi:MAG: serine/threonine-protein kinase, partial [Mycobacteriales bacterium]
MLLAPDVTLGSRYTLRSRIAVGGMGEVWRAEDTVLHREVAVKVLKGDLSGDPSFLDRFRAEARHTAALAHPGIANVFDYGEATTEGSEQTDLAYLVMELIDGEPMSALLGREQRLPADQALDILAQTALALAAAHAAGVIHRDVKPGNIMIRPDGTVKITDFGIARAVNAAPVTATGMVMGTSFYLSPEQASGQLVTPASDVYSLGVVGYEALSGYRPFAADSPLTVAMMHIRDDPPPLPDDVPPAARALVERAMAKAPEARFPSAEAMAEAATAARGGVTEPGSTAAMGAPTSADPSATTV